MESANNTSSNESVTLSTLNKCLAGGLAAAAVVAFFPYSMIFGWVAAFFSLATVEYVFSLLGSAINWTVTLLVLDLRVSWLILLALGISLICIQSKVKFEGYGYTAFATFSSK